MTAARCNGLGHMPPRCVTRRLHGGALARRPDDDRRSELSSQWKLVRKLRLRGRGLSTYLAAETLRDLVDELLPNHLQRQTKYVEPIRSGRMSQDGVIRSFHSNGAYPQSVSFWCGTPELNPH